MGFIPGAANLGVYPNPIGETNHPAPSSEDIARVAVAVLIDPTPPVGKRYRPTSARRSRCRTSRSQWGAPWVDPSRSGRRVPSDVLEGGRVAGFTGFEISNTRHYFEEGKRGTSAINAPTKGLRELTGREPEDLEAIVQRYTALPSARRSFRSVLRELSTMLQILLMPRFDPTGSIGAGLPRSTAAAARGGFENLAARARNAAGTWSDRGDGVTTAVA